MVLIITTILIGIIYRIITDILASSMKDKPLPDNVRDIYDSEKYSKWKAYSEKLRKNSFLSKITDSVFTLVLFVSGAFPALSSVLPENEYLNSVILFSLYITADSILTFPFSYHSQMKIEAEYGFNKYTVKSFIADTLKQYAFSLLLTNGILCLFILMKNVFGDGFPIVGALVMIVLIVIFQALSKVFQRIFNKFTPLEDGSLKEKLSALAASYGFQLRDVSVMKASEKTTKSDAFCTGLGRFKEIAIFDNMIEKCPEDEIVGIFAHELAHSKFGDMLTLTVIGCIRMSILVAGFAAIISSGEIFTSLGFDGINYAAAFIALFTIAEPFLILFDIPVNFVSRKCETRADAFAAAHGYGSSMISAFKRLASDDFMNLNPHPFIVACEYNHPTISDRITAMEKYQAGSGKDGPQT